MKNLITQSTIWETRRIDTIGCDIGNNEGNYVPLNSLFVSNDITMFGANVSNNEQIAAVGDFKLDTGIPIYNMLYSFFSNHTGNINKQQFHDDGYVEDFLSRVDKFINSYNVIFPIKPMYLSTNSHMNLKVGFFTNRLQRSGRLYTGKGYCRVLSASSSLDTLCCIMIKKKYIPLFKLYYLMGIEPFGEMFEFWYDDTIIDGGLKKIPFLSLILREFRDDGILIRQINGIDKRMLAQYSIPNINSQEDIKVHQSTVISNIKDLLIKPNGNSNNENLRKLCNF